MWFKCVGFWVFCLVTLSGLVAGTLDEKGRPLPEVIQIFQLLSPLLPNEVHEKLMAKDAGPDTLSAEMLLAFSKKTLKCPEEMTTWDSRFIRKFSTYDTSEIRNLFEKIGFLKKMDPVVTFPTDYILVFGGGIESIQERFQAVGMFYQQDLVKVRASSQVLFLGTNRPLNLFEVTQLRQTYPRSSVLPKTEEQALEWIWEHQALPGSLQALSAGLILQAATSKQPVTEGKDQSMLRRWLAGHPAPGHCLIVSNQPFVAYHQALLNNLFLKLSRQKWSFEVVGDKPAKHVSLAVLADTLIRTLELEVALMRSSKKEKGKRRKERVL